jgi:hypothetical protein
MCERCDYAEDRDIALGMRVGALSSSARAKVDVLVAQLEAGQRKIGFLGTTADGGDGDSLGEVETQPAEHNSRRPASDHGGNL